METISAIKKYRSDAISINQVRLPGGEIAISALVCLPSRLFGPICETLRRIPAWNDVVRESPLTTATRHAIWLQQDAK